MTFDRAAEILLEEQAHRLPDLSGVVVLIPHHHVIRPFHAALRLRVRQLVFRPPRLLTLPGLAGGVPDSEPSQPDSLRLAELHAFLRRITWLAEAGRWPTAQALHALLQEMDDALLAPPDDFNDFARQVAGAGRRVLAGPLEAEARLAFDVWRAFHAGKSSQLGSRATYARRLADWLDRADCPLYTLGLHGLSRLEQRFLTACADRLPCRELPVDASNPDRLALLDAAWQVEGDSPALRQRASDFARIYPHSPLRPGNSAAALEFSAGPDLESLAQGVALRIRLWLAEGRRKIGVIALDRLAARRLRAVLERHDILLQDETGWTFSTAVVSHVLDRWLDLVAAGGYFRDVLDLLKSPFLFADIPSDARLAGVHALERAVRQEGVTEGLDRFIELARRRGLQDALNVLERLAAAMRQFPTSGRLPLAEWLRRLLAVLDSLGARAAWSDDTAGRQMLDLLQRLARELTGDATRHGFSEWRAWLTLQLDTATFLEDEVESPLRLTHLAAARLREFEAVVILGADASHLPPSAAAGLFNDGVRLELGLPGQAMRRAEALAALRDVLGQTEQALIVWQDNNAVGPNPPSPWLEILDAFHRLAYGTSLRVRLPLPVPAPDDGMALQRTSPPAPTLGRAPERLSASAWQTLVACPYRYFARYGLGLGEEEEVAEEMEKRDYGELVHAILARFHAAHPLLAEAGREALLADLQRISQLEFAQWLASFPLAEAWLLRWEKQLAGYLDWALAREAQGYRWTAAEQRFEQPLDFGDGRTVMLQGRLDRIDMGPNGPVVLDYKTQSRQTLRKKLKQPGEDVQLPFYALLTGAAEAAFVGLDDEKLSALGLEGGLTEAAAAEAERLVATLQALDAGAPMPAQGAPETCQWCEMRGLCRRDHW